jgi:hypothetical protein
LHLPLELSPINRGNQSRDTMGAAFCARALHLLAAPALSRIEIIHHARENL